MFVCVGFKVGCSGLAMGLELFRSGACSGDRSGACSGMFRSGT